MSKNKPYQSLDKIRILAFPPVTQESLAAQECTKQVHQVHTVSTLTQENECFPEIHLRSTKLCNSGVYVHTHAHVTKSVKYLTSYSGTSIKTENTPILIKLIKPRYFMLLITSILIG